MDFRHFRYFVTVAEELHVARAAERLGIAQPALSQQIKALEHRLGVSLFLRANRRIALTEAGQVFLTEARIALECAQKAVEVAQSTARGEAGTVNIGFVSSVMYEPDFPLLLKTYCEKHPGIRLALNEMPILEQIADVHEQRLDIAILRTPLPVSMPERLEMFTLASQRLVAVLSDSHPLADADRIPLQDLSQDGFVAFHDPEGIGLGHALLCLCRDAGFEPDVVLRVFEVTTLISLVAAGFGVSLVPESLAHLKLPNVKYIPLSGIETRSELVVVHRQFERSAAVRALLKKIRESAG